MQHSSQALLLSENPRRTNFLYEVLSPVGQAYVWGEKGRGSMTKFEQAISYLPERLQKPLQQLPVQWCDDVHEIRLREDAPVVLSTSQGDFLVTRDGKPTKIPVPHLLTCTHEQVEGCFLQLCDYSVHSHQREILQGYISTLQGFRVGVAGCAVMEQGEMVSMRKITSLCIRVSRPHDGCADELLKGIVSQGRLCSTLICGEPSSGKSSLLRDAARQLSGGYKDRRYRVSVVDERGELSADKGLFNCDVLLHFPKGPGILQAVRCLAPDVVAFDELGGMEEAQAVVAGLNAGVAAIATVHGSCVADVLHRPPVYYTLQSGGFERIAFLRGRQAPGEIDTIMKVEDMLGESHRIAFNCSDRGRNRTVQLPEAETPGSDFAVI